MDNTSKKIKLENLSGIIPGNKTREKVDIPGIIFYLLKRSIPMVVLFTIWTLVSLYAEKNRGVIFPGPIDTFMKLLDIFAGEKVSDENIYIHLRDSLLRWTRGFIFASITGILYGLAAGWSRSFEKSTWPILNILQLIPGLAWIPVALLIFGIGETSTVFMISITAFTPIAMNLFSGIKQLDHTFIRAAKMMGADNISIFFRVLIPGSLPSLISGLRLGLGNGWRVLVAGEMVVGTGTGLGHSIIQARWTLDYESAFACIVLICLTGLVVENLIFKTIEKRTIEKWS